ncbi:hypothetical protein [uncultured Imperialibacter sp.]|uniref:hypothetical protein n=1 Tax=uncultured Imperialibacter sp. TaxID=1672639 RepID=UPI0030D8E3C0|tara:strand:- start:16482 stop:16826 length:345 start_codon:yes stop_codon:yes gene_type:complete
MYRSVAALFLLIVMAFSQGASANVYESSIASKHALLASGHTDYLQPYVAVFDAGTGAGFVKLPVSKFPGLQGVIVADEAALTGFRFVSLSHTSDHDKKWITEVTALLYPAHEFS